MSAERRPGGSRGAGLRAGRPRAGRASILAVVAGAALALAPALPAAAHNYPIGSSPADGATVTEQPGSVSLTTNDALLDLGASHLDVIGPDGRHYATACAAVDGATVSAPADLGPAGEYTAEWQVVSVDGHPISGEFAFEWAPGEGVALADGAAEAVCGEADATGAPGGQSDEGAQGAGISTDALWIGGGVLGALVVAFVAWLVLRRPREDPPA